MVANVDTADDPSKQNTSAKKVQLNPLQLHFFDTDRVFLSYATILIEIDADRWLKMRQKTSVLRRSVLICFVEQGDRLSFAISDFSAKTLPICKLFARARTKKMFFDVSIDLHQHLACLVITRSCTKRTTV